MKKVLLFCIVLIVAVSLIGCGRSGGGNDPAIGSWKASQMELAGMSMMADEIYQGGFYLDIKEGGKATMRADNESIDGAWEVDGNQITFDFQGETFAGTIDSSAIVIEDMVGTGMTVTFEKE